MGSSSGLQAEKKEQIIHPHLWLVAGSWGTLSGHWGSKEAVWGKVWTQIPLPSLPCSQEPSKNSLWAWEKQLLMTRVTHNWSLTGYTNVLIYWYQKHAHSLEFGVHPWDWLLVPLTRDKGRKHRPRQRLQLKSIIWKVPPAIVLIMALHFCLLSLHWVTGNFRQTVLFSPHPPLSSWNMWRLHLTYTHLWILNNWRIFSKRWWLLLVW